MSQPAQSRPWAMRDYPHARRREVETLLELAALRPGMVVLDLQAADGYLADRVLEHLGGEARCICVEPSPLRHRIRPAHRVLSSPLHDIAGPGDGSVDRVLGLAGLHHSEDPAGVLLECQRLLRPGGMVAICDVERESRMDHWLNGFVARHHPGGHDGVFFSAGEMRRLFEEAGFLQVEVRRREVPWSFPGFDHLVRFCRGLFGLECPDPVIAEGIRELLDVREGEEGVELDWSLLYARGSTPA